MCGIAWQHEIDATPVTVYHSLERHKKDHPGWKECGIVRLRVELDDWIVPQNLTWPSIKKKVKK